MPFPVRPSETDTGKNVADARIVGVGDRSGFSADSLRATHPFSETCPDSPQFPRAERLARRAREGISAYPIPPAGRIVPLGANGGRRPPLAPGDRVLSDLPPRRSGPLVAVLPGT